MLAARSRRRLIVLAGPGGEASRAMGSSAAAWQCVLPGETAARQVAPPTRPGRDGR